MNGLKLDWDFARQPRKFEFGIPVFSFGAYYSVKHDDHGPFSRMVLDFKDGRARAIKYFTQALVYMLTRSSLVNTPFYAAVIPPSEQGTQSVAFQQVLTNLARDHGFQIQNLDCNLFNRTQTKERSHRGGSRSLDVHYRTMAVEPSLIPAIQAKGARVLVLDDVSTTGNSMMAAIKLLQLSKAASIVAGIALAQTV